MGQCDCWGTRKKKTSYHPFIYDEEYMEFNAEDNHSLSTYRPPVPSTAPPPPQAQDQELPEVNDFKTQETTQEDQRDTTVDKDKPRQYTQYTESVFLSRPTPPNNSLILNSMMVDSSVLANPSPPSPSSSPSPPSFSSSSTVKDSALQEPESSLYTSSIYYDASSTSFIHNPVTEGAFEPPVDPK